MQKEKILKNEGLAHVSAGVLALGLALIVQYGFGKFPCDLCVLQRYPYGAAIVLGLLFYIYRKRNNLSPLFHALLILAYLATAGIAVYHVGVEQGWIAGPTGCSTKIGGAATIEELRQQIMGAALVSCKDVSANLFGISMAAWNAGYALAMAFGTGILWKMNRKI